MKREADPEEKWLSELSFSTVLTVVGIGLTPADLFFRFYRSKNTGNPPVATATATAITTATPAPQQKACVSPRIGMV